MRFSSCFLLIIVLIIFNRLLYSQISGEFVSNSTAGNGQLNLIETELDFSRITMKNSLSSQYWDMAARVNDDLSLSKLNFYNSIQGDILTIEGRGRIGINDESPSYTVEINGNAITIFNMTIQQI